MKIAIVGTSNSVMKDGWVKYFRLLAPNLQIDNYSIGANPSLFGHYIIEKKNILEEYDFCILDFAVNDQNFLDYEFISEELLVASYLDFIGKFNRSNCIPIFLILPQSRYLKNSSVNRVRKHITFLCRKYNLIYMDLYSLIGPLVNKYPEECFMREPSHITSFVAQIIAELLTEVLKSSDKEKTVIQKIPEFGFRILQPQYVEFYNFITCNRQTNLVEFYTRKALDINKSIIKIYGNDLLCGMFFYNTKDTGNVYFSTDQGIICKSLGLYYPPNRFFFRNFINPIGTIDNIINVSLRIKAEFVDEKTADSNLGNIEGTDFEIVDFLICDYGYRKQINLLKKYICYCEIDEKFDHHKEWNSFFQSKFNKISNGMVDDLIRSGISCSQNEYDDLLYKLNYLKEITHGYFVFFARQFCKSKTNVPLIIFGAGNMCKILLESSEFIRTQTCYLVDNDEKKWGEILHGFHIMEPKFIMENPGCIILVASTWFSDIKKQLIDMGLHENVDFIDARPLCNCI